MNRRENENEIAVGGFLFRDKKTAEQAEREAEGIRFIQEKIDKNEPKTVLEIYNQVVRQNMFVTVVGQAYLRDLQEYLRAVPEILEEDILPIPAEQVKKITIEEQPKKQITPPKRPAAVKAKNVDYKKKFHTAFILDIAFIICIIFMFLINLTSSNVTILNYETKLIDKYEQWENELEEREQMLDEREQELR